MQVKHKAKFLEEQVLLPGRPPAVVLGHSIGTYAAIHAVHEVEAFIKDASVFDHEARKRPKVLKVCLSILGA